MNNISIFTKLLNDITRKTHYSTNYFFPHFTVLLVAQM